MVQVNGNWAGNALRFATYKEATDNAQDLMQRWLLVTDIRVDEREDSPNYLWVNGQLERITDAEVPGHGGPAVG
jgi:hypothetical protein